MSYASDTGNGKQTEPALLLYERIAQKLELQINQDVLKIGDKLPSLRTLCQQYGVSMGTVLQAYYHLESKSLIEARPQSGYYVSNTIKRMCALPKTSQPRSDMEAKPVDEVIQKVYAGMTQKNVTLFSLGVPADTLLPLPKLNKGMVQAMRELPGSGTAYGAVEGDEILRRNIARSSFQWEGNLHPNELITTYGCSHALALSLQAVTEKGDTIVVESPVYFGILQLAQSLGLRTLELPTHPHTGIELDALKQVLGNRKIGACILMSNFNNPLGSSMPDEHKKAAVALMEQYGVPLIEDDIYGDLYFAAKRPKTCKSYDEGGHVLLCGSVSKTLAPGYRVGWVAPGRFYEKVRRIKLFQHLASTTLTEQVVGQFLENGKYEAHMRKLRSTLHTNSLQYIRAVQDYFPEGTKFSRPEGSFFLWVELQEQLNTVDLFERAFKQKISFAPGRIFTMQNQFNNCLRLSFGMPWNARLDQSLKVLGKLIKTAY